MNSYVGQEHFLVAVDCIIFGFDGEHLKLLLIQRGFEPEKGKWSLMGGFVQSKESLDEAANRILFKLTGLKEVYLEQLKTFGNIKRDPVERTMSVVYFALIDIHKYETQINRNFQAGWFPINDYPKLIFDHEEMVELARKRLRYKSSFRPILFELLPEKFTMPQLQNMYEDVYDGVFDKRNFSRKILATDLIIKQKEKDRSSSKRGAYYYKINRKRYEKVFNSSLRLNIMPAFLT